MIKLNTSVVLGAMLGATSSFAADVRFGTEGAYAPWNFLDDSGKLAGFEIELGNEVCKRAELECEWVVNEWDSIIPNLLAGNYDAIIAGMSVTDERLETINFSAEYYPPDPSRFVGSPDNKIDWDNVQNLKIGVQAATIQAAYLEDTLAAENTILQYETPDQSVADLMAGNTDVLLADNTFLTPVVDGSNGAVAYVGPEVSIGGGVAMGLRKDDTELASKLNAALAEMKQDGTVDKLIMEFFETGPFYDE